MSFTAQTLAERVGGHVVGNPAQLVTDGAPLDSAGPAEAAYVADEANLRKLADSRAGVVFVSRDHFDGLPAEESHSRTYVLVDDAAEAFVTVMSSLRPPRPRPDVGVSPHAFVAESAVIGPGTNVHPTACVGEGVVIGANCEILPGVFVGAGCRLGDDVTLHPYAVLYEGVEVGDRVVVHATAVVGADGFGYRLEHGRHEKVPHFGHVRIEDDVEIGASTTVDRGVIGPTVIGQGTKLDNLVMIAHNCQIGRHNVFVGQVGLAGSVTSGDYVVCAGHVGVADHVHLGDRCVIGSKAGVNKNVPDGETWIGLPAQPASEAMRIALSQKKIPEIRKQLKALEAQVAALEARLEEPHGADTADGREAA